MTNHSLENNVIKFSRIKPFDKTIAYKENELIATWLLNHELDIKEGQDQPKDDPGVWS